MSITGLIIIILWGFSCIKLLREHERAVIFRLGRLLPEAKGPGLILVFKPIDSMRKVSLQEVGTAQTDLSPEGKIFVYGEIWNAVSSAPVERGRHVRVRAVEGLKLRVEPVEQKP